MQRSGGPAGTAGHELHRVRRLRWQARAPDASAAFALRTLLHRREDEVRAAVDQVFTRLVESGVDRDRIWHLPSLTLRLDATSLARLDADLPGLVADVLQDALQQALDQASHGSALAEVPGPTEAAAAEVMNHIRLSTPAEAGLGALRTYLVTGILPWALAGLGPEAQQQSLQSAAGAALESLLNRDGTSRIAGLTELLGSTAVPADRLGALLRWLPLLTPAQRERWLAHSPRPAGIAAALARAWLALLAGPGTSLEWTALWLVWPTLAGSHYGSAEGGERGALAPPDAAAVSHWIAGLPAGSANLELPTASGTVDAPSQDRRLAAALLQLLGAPTVAAYAIAPAVRTAPPVAEALKPSNSATNAQLVPLAGLLLLHPYLPRFLGGCGLLDSAERAIDDAHLPRACAVMQALACGDAGAGAAEHQLPLIKLLLGREPDEPLTAALPRPDASDLVEIDGLLAAVRGHWKALGNTSTEGLRLSFLQRRGLLRHAGGAWQLNMQTESFDMLLDLLPWSISVVKLPWMPHPLMVEWRAGAP